MEVWLKQVIDGWNKTEDSEWYKSIRAEGKLRNWLIILSNKLFVNNNLGNFMRNKRLKSSLKIIMLLKKTKRINPAIYDVLGKD